MPLDEMRLMLEQWGNITGEPRGVDYTEVLGSWAGGPMLSRVKCVISRRWALTGFVIAAACGSISENDPKADEKGLMSP